MKAIWVKVLRRAARGWVVPFHVIGDLEDCLSKLIADPSFEGLSREDFEVSETKELHLDPGGALFLEPAVDFTVLGIPCSIRPHKLMWVTEDFTEARERVPGFLRVPQGPGSMPWFVYFTREFQEALLCHLMAMEFEPGMKELRDQLQARHDQIFAKGYTARRAEGGGWNVAAKDQPGDKS